MSFANQQQLQINS